jgi:hypothetical protein
MVRWLLSFVFAALVLGEAPAARADSLHGRPAAPQARAARVVWTDISLPGREPRPELERFLKHVVDEQTKRADWGKRRETPLEARLEVTELSATAGKDVVRVTCTGVGHLKGGQSVRSHFSMGGRPSGRAELERQLLTMLGRGIVGRLAEIARAAHKG